MSLSFNRHLLLTQRFLFLIQLFLYATKKISGNESPLIHHVVPIIDSLTSALDKYIDNVALHPVVCHAALRGLLMLNKYYARTDESIVYRIAMGMFHVVFKSFLTDTN